MVADDAESHSACPIVFGRHFGCKCDVSVDYDTADRLAACRYDTTAVTVPNGPKSATTRLPLSTATGTMLVPVVTSCPA